MATANVIDMKFMIKVLMTISLLTLCVSLLLDRNFISLFLFSAIYVAGFLCRNNVYFWKLSFLFFSLVGIIFSFRIFGGLEPGSRGVVDVADWFDLDFFIFLLIVLSSFAALLMGLKIDRSNKRMK